MSDYYEDITDAVTGQERPIISEFASSQEHYEYYRRAGLGKWGRAAEGVGTVARRAGRKTNRAVYKFLWAVFDVTVFALIWYVYILTQSPALIDWIFGW